MPHYRRVVVCYRTPPSGMHDFCQKFVRTAGFSDFIDLVSEAVIYAIPSHMQSPRTKSI
jgi:hypothetical protein